MFKDLRYIEVLFLIILSWILIDLWSASISCLAYQTLGLDRNNLLHVVSLALFFSLIFILASLWLKPEKEQSSFVSLAHPTIETVSGLPEERQ